MIREQKLPFMDKHHFRNIILILLLIALIAGAVAFFADGERAKIAEIPKFEATKTPSPAQTTLVVAPDGKKTLSMRTDKRTDGVTQTFSMSSKGENVFSSVYSKTMAGEPAISIPFNTFSPDDKYFFLKETVGGTQNYFVLASSGSPVATDSQTLNVSEFFAKKLPDYTLTEVTGWAAPTLLVVNTDKKDGTQGPSFWFDLSTKSFILLSNRFN